MLRLVNALITPGGEIAKRRAFTKVADLPANSFGLAATDSNVVTFGYNVIPVVPALPGGFVGGPTLVGLKVPGVSAGFLETDYDVFDGRIYMVGYQPGVANWHFYDDGKVANTMVAVTEATGKGYYIRTFKRKMYSINGKFLYFSAVDNPTIWNASTTANLVAVTVLTNDNPARCTVAAADISKFTEGQLVTVSGADTAHREANGLHTISSVNSPANTFLLDDVDCTGAAGDQTTGVKVDYRTTSGRGTINMSLVDAQSERLTGLEIYYDKLAVFSSRAIQIWAVDPDPLQNNFEQVLRGSGTYAPKSPMQYGTGDVLYLDHSGVRSLKAKDSSNSASVSDIGSPIDSVISQLEIVLGTGFMSAAIALLEPYVGRFWLVLPDRIYVLSYFPGPKISAWSMFTLPFTAQFAVTAAGRIFFRDTANQLWVYGGVDGNTYEACNVEVRLPYLDGKKPGHNKQFMAFDATMSGAWTVKVSFDFNNADNEETVGVFSPSGSADMSATWSSGRAEMIGMGTHFSLRFYNSGTTLPATISNCAAHYEMADAEA